MSSQMSVGIAYPDSGRPHLFTCDEHMHKILSFFSIPTGQMAFITIPSRTLEAVLRASPWILYRGVANVSSQWKLISWSPLKLLGRFRLY